MAIFSSQKKLARETARRLIGGHLTLTAVWTLRQAGVFTAMRDGPLDVVLYAARTAMSVDVLQALLAYLVQQGLIEGGTGPTARKFAVAPALTALLEHEAGMLEEMRAYQPVLQAMEHLLARLKTYGHGGGGGAGGVARRNDVLYAGQAMRYADEVYPAVERALLSAGTQEDAEAGEKEGSASRHVLDLNCGTGEFLVGAAMRNKNLVGVGLCADAACERAANALIAKQKLDRRLIAIAAGALEVCSDTQRVFERLGISRALHVKLDCVVGVGAFSDMLGQGQDKVRAAIMRLPVAFKGALVVLAEPCAGRSFSANPYAAELELLLALSRTDLLGAEQWRGWLTAARVEVRQETALQSDGMTMFVGRCKRGK